MIETIIQNHAVLLKDKVRMNAYKKAIFETVKEGDVVLDIGCGLGVLSFLAIKAGAKHVHAVEVEPYTLALAKTIAKNNGLLDKITFHKAFSTKLKLKEKVDVVVSEIFGNLGINENIVPVLIDARDRLLKPSGRIVPLKTSVWFSPCEHKDWQFTLDVLHDTEGFDMLPDDDTFDLGTPSVIIKNSELLANPEKFADVDFSSAKDGSISHKAQFTVVRDAVLAGFAGWFEASLTRSVSIATNPSNLTTHWKQALLPLRTKQDVRAGQKIKLEVDISPDRSGLNSMLGYRYEL